MPDAPYRSHSQDTFTASANPTANRPAGVVDGDGLLTWITFDESVTTVITPPDESWVLVPGAVNPIDSATSGDVRSYLYYKIADAEPASWNWGLSAATDGAITTVAYQDVDEIIPIDVGNGAGTVTGTTHTSASIETTVPNARVVMFVALDLSATATPQFSWSGSLTERADWEFAGAIFIEQGFADEVVASPGAVQRAATSVTSDEGTTFIVSLRPKQVLGNSAIGGVVNTADADMRVLTGPFTLPNEGEVRSMWVYIDGSGAGVGNQVMKGVIYASAAGVPGALKMTSDEVTITDGQAVGWVNFPVTVPVILSPGDYWLGLHGGAVHQSAQLYRLATAGKDERWLADTYSDGPADPAGAMNQLTTREYSFYAPYALTGSGSGPPVSPDITNHPKFNLAGRSPV